MIAYFSGGLLFGFVVVKSTTFSHVVVNVSTKLLSTMYYFIVALWGFLSLSGMLLYIL